MVQRLGASKVDRDELRNEIGQRYAGVALTPEEGFHFHVGRPLAEMLAYDENDLNWLPADSLESFAGTGNPFALGPIEAGETVLDLGCGAGVDTLIAARRVGPTGKVIGIDMTPEMLAKAKRAVDQLGLAKVDLRFGYAEELPVESDSVDVLISNGVFNLCPDKEAVMREVYRVLRPGGRLQIADMVVHKEVPQSAKDDIELWSG